MQTTYREFVIQDAVHAADLMAQRLHWMAEVSDETPHRMADYKEALEDFERLQEKAVNLIKDDYGKWEAESDEYPDYDDEDEDQEEDEDGELI